MENQKLRFSFKVFLIQSFGFVYFLEFERFLKSFDALRACLSVTLLARFNKNRLIF